MNIRMNPPGGNGSPPPPWGRLLADSAAPMGLHLSPLHLAQFAAYADELIKWSRRMNLTAIQTPEQIVAKHFMDSLAAADLFAAGQKVLDIGTGAGFPGLPLKLYRPSLSVLLIDGSRKKTNFITHLIHTLSLEDTTAIQIRSEQLRTDPDHRRAYDAVVSRAVCSLVDLVADAIEFVQPGGRIVAWKAARSDQEIAQLVRWVEAGGLQGGMTDLDIQQKHYVLPGFEEKRSLVIVSPQ